MEFGGVTNPRSALQRRDDSGHSEGGTGPKYGRDRTEYESPSRPSHCSDVHSPSLWPRKGTSENWSQKIESGSHGPLLLLSCCGLAGMPRHVTVTVTGWPRPGGLRRRPGAGAGELVPVTTGTMTVAVTVTVTQACRAASEQNPRGGPGPRARAG